MSVVLALVRHPLSLVVLSVGFLVLVLGSVLPTPANWARSADAQLVDVRVDAPLQWHPILGRWTIGGLSTTTSSPMLLDLRAWWTNELSFGFSSGDHAVFTLLDQNGRQLQAQSHATGRATPLTGAIEKSVVFANVAPGAYQVRVVVKDAGGGTTAESTRGLLLASGSVTR